MSRVGSIRSVLPAALLCLCSGCLITHHSTNVVRQDEPRRPVQFESSAAQQAFSARAFDEEAREKAAKTSFFAVPFLLWWSKTNVLSEGAYFNDQVAACDADGDGVISVQEALAYNPKSVVDASKLTQAKPRRSAAAPAAPSPVQPASLHQAADAPTPETVLR
jgi:hypothetical protein